MTIKVHLWKYCLSAYKQMLTQIKENRQNMPKSDRKILQNSCLVDNSNSSERSNAESIDLIRRSSILTPDFKEYHRSQSFKKSVRKKGSDKTENFKIQDEYYTAIHRRLELSERKIRKREEELDRYETYIRKLKREHPELWKKN